MTAFFRHRKFWLPFLLLIGLELLFRVGAWESIAEPDSYAGNSIALKQALQRLGRDRVQAILLGDSRVQYGFDHTAMFEYARENGVVLANMSLPGTHLATHRAVSSWAADQLPQLETVIIGLSPAALSRLGNGDYEIGIVEPFRNFGAYITLANHFPPRLGAPASWGSVSSLASYREDFTGLLANPKRRVQRLIARDLEDPQRRLLFNNPAHETLCAFKLDNRVSCLVELTLLRSQGLADQAAAQSFANWCEPEPATADAEVQKLALLAWRESLEHLARNYRLVVVLMPGHGLLQQAGLETGGELAVETVLRPMEITGFLQLIDLRMAFSGPGLAECEGFRDLVHTNRQGMHHLTRLLLEQLKLQ